MPCSPIPEALYLREPELAALVLHHTVSRETGCPSPTHPDTVLVGTA